MVWSLQEAHIARLEAKIAGFDRSSTKTSDPHVSRPSQMGHHQRSSSESSMVAPRVSLQRSLRLVSSQQQNQITRSTSDYSLIQGLSPRAAAILNQADHDQSHDQSWTGGFGGSRGSVSSSQSVEDSSQFAAGSRSSTRANAGNVLMVPNESNQDSFLGMWKEVNKMYHNQSSTSSANGTTATLQAVRSRLLADTSGASSKNSTTRLSGNTGFSQKSSSSSKSRSASNLTSSSSALLRPKNSNGLQSRPVSDSFAFVSSGTESGNPLLGQSKRGTETGSEHSGEIPVLTLDMLATKESGPSDFSSGGPGSVEKLLVEPLSQASSCQQVSGCHDDAMVSQSGHSNSSGSSQHQAKSAPSQSTCEYYYLYKPYDRRCSYPTLIYSFQP